MNQIKEQKLQNEVYMQNVKLINIENRGQYEL